MSAQDEAKLLVNRAKLTPLLSAAEEVRLAKRIEQGDTAARERMIESNLRLVLTLARSFRGRGVPFADLVQEGTVGLVRAVERFDYRRGHKFSTYAVWWIRRSLLDAVTDSQVIRVPVKANQQLAAIGRARDELARTGPPSNAAIAARTELPEATVRSLWGAARVTASLDDSVGPDATTLGDLIADRDGADPAERAIARERTGQLSEMLDSLPERHRLVLVWRYGLGEQRARSHTEIGASLGVGEERSRQIEREALQRLRSIAPAFRLAA
jgi:RNA polymerase primary sigma factor